MPHMEIKSKSTYLGQMQEPYASANETMSNTLQYDFRPITKKDLPLLAKWLAAPHVAKWWGDNPVEKLDSIKTHMDSVSVEPLIIELDGKPIGYIQSYDPHMEDDHPYQDQPMGTLGIDPFIGDPALIGKGHGPRLIEAFALMLFEEGAPRVIIDPDPANVSAIRAFEKAGFVTFDTRVSIYGPALMMARDATEEEMNP